MEIQSWNLPDTGCKRVVVVGGGFAGLALIKGLHQANFQVVLIDRCNYHLFKPLLYQVASAGLDEGDIAFPFRKIFHNWHQVFYRMAEVWRVRPGEKRIETSLGELTYDYLVLATGSIPDFYGLDGVRQNALQMNDVPDAFAIRNHLLRSFEHAVTAPTSEERQALMNVVIVGAGATGVEIAGAIAEMKRYVLHKDYRDLEVGHMNIYLVEGADRVLPGMGDDTSARAQRALESKGVTVILNSFLSDYAGGIATFRTGRTIPTRNLIWTSGVKCEAIDGVTVTGAEPQNRITVDTVNRVAGQSDIFAIGDVAICHTDKFPKGHPRLARTAISQGQHLATNLIRLQRNEPMEPYRYRNYGVMATVGRNRAFVEFPRYHYGGFPAWLTWSFVHVYFILGIQNKVKVFWGWVWNYFLLDQPLRLILEKYRRKSAD